jgi:hypothetical protein
LMTSKKIRIIKQIMEVMTAESFTLPLNNIQRSEITRYTET